MKKVKKIWEKIITFVKEYKKYSFYVIGGIGVIIIIVMIISQNKKSYLNKADEKVYAIEDTLADNQHEEEQSESNTLENETEMAEEMTENESETKVEQPKSMYDEIAIAHVTNYVNIRKEPNAEAEIVGKIYDGAAATIIGTSFQDASWYQIKSGNVEGFIKAEYFVTGVEASKLADELACKRAVVLTQTLFVRQEPTVESKIVGMVPIESAYQVEQEENEWIRVTIEDGTTGWLNKEYVTIDVEFDTAISLAEEKEALEAQAIRQQLDAQLAKDEKKEQENKDNQEQDVTQGTDTENQNQEDEKENAEENPALTQSELDAAAQEAEQIVDLSSTGDLRGQIISYAEQFLGNPYVWGGNSLEKGTDCSGFVMLVYQKFGYALSRIPSGQYHGVGDCISFSECQPGDIVIYGTSDTNLTHSAIYIGDGKVIHEANRRMGVCISDASTFGKIYGCKRVLSM